MRGWGQLMKCVCRVAVIVVSLILFSLPARALDIDSELNDVICEERGSIIYNGKELKAVQCDDYVVFSDYTMTKVPQGAIFLRLDNDFYFYTPSLDALRKVDLDQLEFGGAP